MHALEKLESIIFSMFSQHKIIFILKLILAFGMTVTLTQRLISKAPYNTMIVLRLRTISCCVARKMQPNQELDLLVL